MAAAEERLNYLRKSAVEKAEFAESKKEENNEITGDIESRLRRKVELELELEKIQSVNYDDLDFTDLEERVALLKEQLTEKEELLVDLKQQQEDSRVELTKLDSELFKNQSKQQEFSASLQDINEEIESLEKHTTSFSDELNHKRTEYRELEVKVSELGPKIELLKTEIRLSEESFKNDDEKLRLLNKELIQLESRIDSLIEVNKNEGSIEGALAFMQATESESYQVFGDLIGSKPDYAKCLEVLFHDLFNSLVSIDENLGELSNWSTSSLDKAWQLLLVTDDIESYAEATERLKLKLGESLIPVNELIEIKDKGYYKQLTNIFDGYYVVDQISFDQINALKNLRFKGIVDLSSSNLFTKANGQLLVKRRDTAHESMGFVQRNNVINEMTLSLEQKKVDFESLTKTVNATKQKLDGLKVELEKSQEQFNQSNAAYLAAKATLESKESGYQASFSRMDIISKRKIEISKTRLDLIEQEEQIVQELDSARVRLDESSHLVEEISDSLTDLKQQFESKREELLTLKANASSYQSQIDSINSQMLDVDQQVDKFEKKIATNNELLAKMEEEIESMLTSSAELEQSNHSLVDELTSREEALNLIKDELAQLMLNMQDRENRVKELNQTINQNEKSLVEVEMKLAKIVQDEALLVRDIFEKYQIDLRGVLADHLQIDDELLANLEDTSAMYLMQTESGEVEVQKNDYAFDKRFPAQVKESAQKYKNYKSDLSRLGNINWQAIEEYDRQKLRYDFLKVQEQELKSSLADLEAAINHIDQKCKVRFKEAYDEVNERFSKVFPIIFGGGNAKLQIVGDLDSPECGIDIIAQPPGKKMQNINLMSGGEKAMTAVSLIFSIFLVKPSPFCLLDEVDAPLDDANVGRFNELLREMSQDSQFILITHNKKTMELNDTLYGVTMQDPGVSKAVSVQLH